MVFFESDFSKNNDFLSKQGILPDQELIDNLNQNNNALTEAMRIQTTHTIIENFQK